MPRVYLTKLPKCFSPDLRPIVIQRLCPRDLRISSTGPRLSILMRLSLKLKRWSASRSKDKETFMNTIIIRKIFSLDPSRYKLPEVLRVMTNDSHTYTQASNLTQNMGQVSSYHFLKERTLRKMISALNISVILVASLSCIGLLIASELAQLQRKCWLKRMILNEENISRRQ